VLRKQPSGLTPDSTQADQKELDEVSRMIGDVNLFLLCSDESASLPAAEIDVMIAEKNARRKGYGREAVGMMLVYGLKVIGIR
jgi:hypothetical protein